MTARYLSIKTRFFLTAAIIMALTSATWGGWAWYNERQHMIQKLSESGKLLLTALRAPIISTFIYDDAGALEDVGMFDTFVEEVMTASDVPTRYAFITDADGTVLAHTDYSQFRTLACDPLTRASLNADSFLSRITHSSRGEEILDLALPLRVAGKCWGTLRVGYSMAPLKRELQALTWQVATFSVVFFLLGTAVFYVIGIKMSRPLVRLSRAMTGLNHDSLEEIPEPSTRNDEIGDLQESFREMVLRLRRSERERAQAVSRLLRAEKLATIGEIVAGVAHEVNNPLAAMSFSLAQIEKKAPAELTRRIDIVKGGLSRIETIMRQLTEFSRSGSLELRAIRSDLFFREATDFAAVALQKYSLRLEARCEGEPAYVTLDKGKVHQVVLNLVINAAQASTPDATVELSARVEGAHFLITVKDRGEGIPREKQGRIFELFYTTKTAGEGTGIGLAVAKSIVEMHRGEITVASAPGETIFTVKIPRLTGETDEKPETFDSRG